MWSTVQIFPSRSVKVPAPLCSKCKKAFRFLARFRYEGRTDAHEVWYWCPCDIPPPVTEKKKRRRKEGDT